MKFHRSVITAGLFLLPLLSPVHAIAQEIIDADILLKNGSIYDGSGKAAV